jgi:hypothetical protein
VRFTVGHVLEDLFRDCLEVVIAGAAVKARGRCFMMLG